MIRPFYEIVKLEYLIMDPKTQPQRALKSSKRKLQKKMNAQISKRETDGIRIIDYYLKLKIEILSL